MDFNSDERMVDLKHRPRTRCCSLKSGTTSTRNRSTISYHHPVCLYMLGRWVIQTSFHSFSFSSFPCSGGGGGGEGGGGGITPSMLTNTMHLNVMAGGSYAE